MLTGKNDACKKRQLGQNVKKSKPFIGNNVNCKYTDMDKTSIIKKR